MTSCAWSHRCYNATMYFFSSWPNIPVNLDDCNSSRIDDDMLVSTQGHKLIRDPLDHEYKTTNAWKCWTMFNYSLEID